MLGLSKRAGAAITGTPMVIAALKEKKIQIVFYPSDASANTQKKITDKCAFYGVPCVKTERTSVEIGNAVGKLGAVCAVGITDKNFSNELSTLNLNEKR
jgi:ribosomal protein L7Ae-like RNA K-turn-binding protein